MPPLLLNKKKSKSKSKWWSKDFTDASRVNDFLDCNGFLTKKKHANEHRMGKEGVRNSAMIEIEILLW